ncbi:MAG: GUN4 domain-containing protein, partial [Cyanophyceae cyanobacterium]
GGVPSIAGRLQTCDKVPQGRPPLQDLRLEDNFEIQLWQLETKLANQEWQEADFITAGIINLRHKEVILRYRNGDLSSSRNQQISRQNSLFCEDLRALDRVWTTYSNEKFGFSIQQTLMPPEFNLSQVDEDDRIYNTSRFHFAEKVGWLLVDVYRGWEPWRPGLLLEPLDEREIDLSNENISRVLRYFERGATYDSPDDPPAGFYPYALGISYFPETVSGVPVPVPASPVYDTHWPAGFADICPLVSR